MNKLPANTGWLWVKQGFQYFRQQPMEFSTLFIVYLLFMLIVEFIPYVGQTIAFILMPLFTLSFMQACREIDHGVRVHPRMLLYSFRLPQARRLMQLGVLYLLAACIAIAASTLIDGGVFLQFITGQKELNAKMIEQSDMTLAMLFAMLVYLPALLAFWFAGPLIAWQDMPLFKAIFYSFFAALKSIRVFLIYGLSWFALGGIVPSILSIIFASITGNPNTIIFIMMPMSMILTIILYCSFYPSYKSIFAQADEAPSSTIS